MKPSGTPCSPGQALSAVSFLLGRREIPQERLDFIPEEDDPPA
jgi:hypothetical protein